MNLALFVCAFRLCFISASLVVYSPGSWGSCIIKAGSSHGSCLYPTIIKRHCITYGLSEEEMCEGETAVTEKPEIQHRKRVYSPTVWMWTNNSNVEGFIPPSFYCVFRPSKLIDVSKGIWLKLPCFAHRLCQTDFWHKLLLGLFRLLAHSSWHTDEDSEENGKEGAWPAVLRLSRKNVEEETRFAHARKAQTLSLHPSNSCKYFMSRGNSFQF